MDAWEWSLDIYHSNWIYQNIHFQLCVTSRTQHFTVQIWDQSREVRDSRDGDLVTCCSNLRLGILQDMHVSLFHSASFIYMDDLDFCYDGHQVCGLCYVLQATVLRQWRRETQFSHQVYFSSVYSHSKFTYKSSFHLWKQNIWLSKLGWSVFHVKNRS